MQKQIDLVFEYLPYGGVSVYDDRTQDQDWNGESYYHTQPVGTGKTVREAIQAWLDEMEFEDDED